MKYKDLDKELVKKCCKTHARIDEKTKKIHFNCEKCPLRRERHLENKPITKTLFCYYVLMQFYDQTMAEYEELKNEDIHHEDEWKKFIERFKTVE